MNSYLKPYNIVQTNGWFFKPFRTPHNDKGGESPMT